MDDDQEMLDEYDFSQAKRGPVVPSPGNKTRITIRIDTDILNWFRGQVNKAGGGSYQANICLLYTSLSTLGRMRWRLIAGY